MHMHMHMQIAESLYSICIFLIRFASVLQALVTAMIIMAVTQGPGWPRGLHTPMLATRTLAPTLSRAPDVAVPERVEQDRVLQ